MMEFVLEAIEAFNDLNDVESHNRSLGLDLSIYGKASWLNRLETKMMKRVYTRVMQ